MCVSKSEENGSFFVIFGTNSLNKGTITIKQSGVVFNIYSDPPKVKVIGTLRCIPIMITQHYSDFVLGSGCVI